MSLQRNTIPEKEAYDVARPDKFFLVVGAGPSGRRHCTWQDAIIEAERLALNNPDEVFYIMENVTMVSLVTTQDSHDKNSGQIPPDRQNIADAQYPMLFRLPMQRGVSATSETVVFHAYVQGEQELGWLLWRHDPSRLMRLNPAKNTGLCQGGWTEHKWAWVFAGEALREGVPDHTTEFAERVMRRRKHVPLIAG